MGGHPVTFVHFRGFSPDQPYVLAPAARLAMSERPDLVALCARYARDLRSAGLTADGAPPYRYGGLADGTPIDDTMRDVYRAALARSRRGDEPAPPNPFDGDGRRLPGLAPGARRARSPADRVPLPRQRWRTDGHPSMYFELVGETAERYLDWCASATDAEIPASLRPTVEDVRRARRTRALTRPRGPAPTGVNVVGYLRSASGLGEVGRSFVRALDTSGVSTAVLDRADIPSPRHETIGAPEAHTLNDLLDVNVVCITADQFPRLARDVGPDFFAGRRTAGLWFWEVDAFPHSMLPAIDLVDEIWVPSDFVARRARTPHHQTTRQGPDPHPVPRAEPRDRATRAQHPRGPVRVRVRIRLPQRRRAQEPVRPRRRVHPGLPTRRRSLPRHQIDQRKPRPPRARAPPLPRRRPTRHLDRRRLPPRRPPTRPLRRLRRLRLAPPLRGVRAHHRRSHVPREARHRDRLLRQPRVHQPRELVPGRLAAHPHRPRSRPLPPGRVMGRPGPRPRRPPHAVGVRRSRRRPGPGSRRSRRDPSPLDGRRRSRRRSPPSAARPGPGPRARRPPGAGSSCAAGVSSRTPSSAARTSTTGYPTAHRSTTRCSGPSTRSWTKRAPGTACHPRTRTASGAPTRCGTG